MELPKGAVLSHASAAAVWGIELVDPDECVHVTVARNASRLRPPGFVVHRGDADAMWHDGCLVTTPMRTLLDLARTLPLGAAVAAADSALRRGLVTLDELQRAAGGLPPARGSSAVRAMAAHVDPRAESVLESLLRVLLAGAGLLPPACQHIVCVSDRFVARVDFAWPDIRLAVEADGFAFHSNREAYRRDRERLNALELAGWRVVRFTWEDVQGRPEAVIATVRALVGSAG